MSLILIFAAQACTQKIDGPVPELSAYEKDGALMISICQKFAVEPDAKKLNSAAVAVQAARVISCSNYNDECNIYGRCLTKAIEISKDGDVSAAERNEIKKNVEELRSAIREGKAKLQTSSDAKK